MANNEIVARIAQKIRAVRLKKKLTIQQLAVKANVTKGLLSKIENSRTIPSLPVFVKILESLGISLKDFFGKMVMGDEKDYWIIQKNQYLKTERQGGPGFDHRLILSQSLPASTAQIYLLRISPGENSSLAITDGYEFQHVISGTFEYHINDEVINMEEGDSILLDASIPHTPVNTSAKEAVMLAVYFLFKNNDGPL